MAKVLKAGLSPVKNADLMANLDAAGDRSESLADRLMALDRSLRDTLFCAERIEGVLKVQPSGDCDEDKTADLDDVLGRLEDRASLLHSTMKRIANRIGTIHADHCEENDGE